MGGGVPNMSPRHALIFQKYTRRKDRVSLVLLGLFMQNRMFDLDLEEGKLTKKIKGLG